MDEPTAGVDEVNQRILAATISRLIADGVAVITSPTSWTRSRPAVTRAVAMRGGQIVADGTPSEVAAAAQAGHQHHHLPPRQRSTVISGAPNLGGHPHA